MCASGSWASTVLQEQSTETAGSRQWSEHSYCQRNLKTVVPPIMEKQRLSELGLDHLSKL
jgi:hypothetical protein